MLSAAAGVLVVGGILAAWTADRISAGRQLAAAEAATATSQAIERQQQYAANIRHAAEALRRGSRSDALSLLEACRSLADDPKHRGIEWGLLWAEANSADRNWDAHPGGVCSVRFSPNGDSLLSAGIDGRVVCWDTTTWQRRWELKSGGDEAHFAETSADGTLIAVGYEHGRIVVYQLNDRSVLYDDSVGIGRLFALTWLGDHKQLAVGGETGVLVLIDPLQGKVRRGERLVVSAKLNVDNRIYVDEINGLSYVPARDAIAVVTKPADNYLIDVSSLAVLRSWSQKSSAASAVCDVPIGSGYLATTTIDPLVRLSNLGDESTAVELPLAGTARTLRFSSAGKMLVAGLRDGRVETWDISEIAQGGNRHGRTISAHGGRTLTVDVSADASWLASGGQDGRINLWGCRSLRAPFDVPLASAPRGMKFSPCGRYLAVTEVDPNDGLQTTMFNVETGEAIWSTDRRPFPEAYRALLIGLPTWPIAFSPDGNEIVFTEGEDGFRGRNSQTGETAKIYTISGSIRTQSLEFTSAGETLVVDRKVDGSCILDRVSAEIVKQFPQRSIWCLRRLGDTPQDLWVEMDHSRRIVLRDSPHAGPTMILTGPTERISYSALSCDGRYLAVGGQERVVYCWDLTRPGAPSKYVGHDGEILGLGFSRDGKTILSHSADGTTRLWHTATRAELVRLGTPKEPVLAMALNPAGDLLVLGIQRDDRYGLRFLHLGKGQRVASKETIESGTR